MLARKILLLLFTLSSGYLSSQSIAPVGAEWYYSISQFGGSAPPNAEYAKYQVTKDTLYKGQLAKQIEREYFRYSGDTVKWSTLYLFDRNDTVFYYNDQYSRYIPLYIFNTIAGDTLRFYYPDTAGSSPTDSTFSLVVDSIKMDSFPNAIVLKAIYTSTLGSFTLSGSGLGLPYLEKIGSLSIMLPRVLFFPIQDGPLRCYQDSTINVNYTTKACDQRVIVGISNLELAEELIQLAPSPVSDVLNIKIGDLIINNIAIYNMNGSLVQSISKGKSSVDVSSFDNGIYLVQFQSDFGLITKKFIVSH